MFIYNNRHHQDLILTDKFKAEASARERQKGLIEIFYLSHEDDFGLSPGSESATGLYALN